MLKSSFQFTTPVLTSINYDINNNFQPREKLKMPIQFSVSDNYVIGTLFSKVDLSIRIGKKSKNYPYYLSATMSADFKWESEKYNDMDIKFLLSHNAPALLLAYLRPIIANITNVSPYPVYNIPFIDFTAQSADTESSI